MEVEVVTTRNPRRVHCISRQCQLRTPIRIPLLRTPRIPCTISHRPPLTNRTVSLITETHKPPVHTRPMWASPTRVHTREMVVSRDCPPQCLRARPDTHLRRMARLSIRTACHPTYRALPLTQTNWETPYPRCLWKIHLWTLDSHLRYDLFQNMVIRWFWHPSFHLCICTSELLRPQLVLLSFYGFFQPKCPLGSDKIIFLKSKLQTTLKILPCLLQALTPIHWNVLTKAILIHDLNWKPIWWGIKFPEKSMTQVRKYSSTLINWFGGHVNLKIYLTVALVLRFDNSPKMTMWFGWYWFMQWNPVRYTCTVQCHGQNSQSFWWN